MHREIRLKESAMSAEKALETIKKGSYGVLSTIGEDGYPYGVPLNYSYLNGYICYHCAQQGHKLDNIASSSKVSFCVVTKLEILDNKFDTDYESVIAFGRAIEVTDEVEKEEILMSMLNKYSANYIEAGKNYIKKYWDETKVFKVAIEKLSGKMHV